MDTYKVKMLVMSNSASTFIIEMDMEGENELDAGQKCMMFALQRGVTVLPQAGGEMIHLVAPAGVIPFDIKKTSLVSVASSLPGGLVRP